MSDEDLQQCIFCANHYPESQMIAISTNSLCIDNRIYEFFDLIRKLLHCKVSISKLKCLFIASNLII